VEIAWFQLIWDSLWYLQIVSRHNLSSIAILKTFGYIDCLFYRRHAPAKFHTNLSKKTTIHATSTE
jgi:hypothetical protein